jgi:DNA-binding transcriptional MocR family regulator
MLEKVKARFGKKVEIIFNETSLYITLKFQKEYNRSKIEKLLADNSVCIMPYKNEKNLFSLSFSGISIERIDEGINIISKVLLEN